MTRSIAIFGHRGWVAGHVIKALLKTGVTLKVIHRPRSVTSDLPETVLKAEAAFEDEDALVDALRGVDIAISLVGHAGFADQHKLVPALIRAGVKLFVPSDLSSPATEQDLARFPILRAKYRIQNLCAAAGVPYTVVLAGVFTESSLRTNIIGIDVQENRIVVPEGAEKQPLNFCSAPYVGAAYASLFANTPIAELAGRRIWLSELAPTGQELIRALGASHGSPPIVVRPPHDKLVEVIQSDKGNIGIVCMRMWADGTLYPGEGSDVHEVHGYEKASLKSLLSGGLGEYRVLGPRWEDVASLVSS